MPKTRKKGIKFDIVSIFPEAFRSYFEESLIKRARKSGLLDINVVNLRDFTADKHQKVDDRPFGGGPGMVLKVDPFYKAVQSLTRKKKNSKTRIVLFSTRGDKFSAKTAARLSKYDRLILLCGRYEGVDERVAEHLADEEISMGDYVLSGGELPAMVLVEAVARFLPGFLGKYESLEEIKGSYPVFTRPVEFEPGGKQKAWVVPKVLLSGDHAKIQAWRRQNSQRGE